MKTKILNLIFRVLTLGGKFLLSIYLVKELGLEANGSYGVFLTTVTLLTYVLGVDFYTFTTRQILQENKGNTSIYLFNQTMLFGILYLVFLPLTTFIWYLDFINPKYLLVFYIILVFEHISTELYRILVTFSMPVVANLNLFLRSGIWCIALVGLWLLGVDSLKSLEYIFQFWIAGSVLSIIVSLYSLKNQLSATNLSLDFAWVKKGVVVAFPFFIASLCYKLMQFSDRYMVEFYLGTVDTGIYIFFANISMLVETFVQTTVVMIFSPKLVSAYANSKIEFKKIKEKFSKQLVVASVLSVIGVCVIIYPLLLFVEKQELLNNTNIFFIMVATRFIFTISLIYHFCLYVSKNDKSILIASVIAVIVNFVLNIWLIPIYGMTGSAVATLIGFLVLLLVKMYYTRKNDI